MYWRLGRGGAQLSQLRKLQKPGRRDQLGHKRGGLRIFMGEREGQSYQTITVLSVWSEVCSTLVPETEKTPRLFIPSV